MGTLFNSIGLSLFLLALATIALIFRDAFPLLNPGDQTTFRHWIGRKVRLQSRAIDNVWKQHVRSFPESRKRALFVSFLVASRSARCGLPTLAGFCRTVGAFSARF
jgi:hypothetical protein